MKVLIIGDSQAGSPGAAAQAALRAAGHTVTRVHNDGKSPVAYVNTPALWSQYTTLAAQADLVVLIFGSNSPAGNATRNALERMRTAVRAPVLMSGPPQYPRPENQQVGTALRTQNSALFGERYIDAWPHTPPTLTRDAAGLHLSASAAQGWGQAIAAAATAAMAPGGAATRPFGVGSSWLAAAGAIAGTVLAGVLVVALVGRR